MTTYSPSGSPAAAAFVFRPQRRSLGFLLSVTLHVALAAFFLWSAPVPPPVELPPPAVMLTFSADIENNQLTKPLPVGIVQAVDSAASSQQEAVQQQQKNITPPVNESAEIKLVQQHKKPKEQQKRPKPVQKTQERSQDQTRASAASAAAPPATASLSDKIAAPMNSDSTQSASAKVTWETRVKVQLNRLKKYPQDAIARHRTGVAQVAFVVDARGEIVSSRLLKSSGTMSMDREALAVLQRASPLPPPPGDMLKAGQVPVSMPLEFTLSDGSSRKS
ncbi:energy transducer TonB [Rahnella contaminans]|uniref:Energy transducer TonB n=1 Tax=Rahnella contaminans TaxID=2703882 RepID=A0A6M2B9F0_9GAMM|nr:TonB family protein [Rahnella contaminans]NGX89625.1 energy transducer TonB [Rahnella contaminans]